MSGNSGKCPFCNSDRRGKTDEDRVEEMMKRVEANNAGAICALGSSYLHGQVGLLQDEEKANELWTQAADLGSSKAQYHLGIHFDDGGDVKKAKFHAAMAGCEATRYNLGCIEAEAQNMEQAISIG
jgi:TPR repeat protein